MTLPPATCVACQVNKVAWVKPRVDFCYRCLPGGPFTPPPCRACGSTRYYSDGLCDRCHPGGPMHVGSCRGCLAWGVYRQHNWHCWSCRWWQNHYPTGVCDYCGRTTPIGRLGACRLCLEQARIAQQPGQVLPLAAANRDGQQLFFANMQPRRHNRVWEGRSTRPAKTPQTLAVVPVEQLALFRAKPDPALVKKRALGLESELVTYCTGVVLEQADKHGWSTRQRNDAIRSLRILQVLQDTPGAKIRASEVQQLSRYGGSVMTALDILDAAGLLIDDRPDTVTTYYTRKTAGLPRTMTSQLDVWLDVMLHGSQRAPRRRSRDPQTARLHILSIAAIAHTWADAGHRSFAEISTDHIRAALPERGPGRTVAEAGLRSLFSVLKARKLTFTDPTRGMRFTPVNHTVPLPLNTAAIRAALDSPDPAVALGVALVCFHALTSQQLIDLELTDIADNRITLDGRSIPIAQPVKVRLTAYLDHRQRTWPASINPHLFISRRSAPRLRPVGRQFLWQ
ncbi:hypothetical protein [Nakamurella sp.]|uniref:hypothetical protein n=1 Tax=Nakamurella sp. TaxID=1869182 RepID=UPI003B3A7431